MPWRPGKFSLELEQPYEDVPDHLAVPLWQWVEQVLVDNEDIVKYAGIHLRIPLPQDPFDGIDALRTQAQGDLTLILDLIEFLLSDHFPYRLETRPLQSLLTAGNSLYRVNDAEDGLEERVSPEVKAAVQEVVSSAGGSAGEHLATAWNAAYGRSTDPVKAYSEAIKAVESAAAPVVSPKNLKATLGTIIAQVKGNPSLWRFAIAGSATDSVLAVQSLMSVLWEGQTSRHGGVNPTRPETVEEARSAVHIAVLLVQTFASGAFTRR
ncbi:MAG TPA: hypothetical protein VGX28_06705 [Frankiaceae bacterium]|jgi:hypothetical protein|nr:hypothetical protein [Frankiaceae bacterium]